MKIPTIILCILAISLLQSFIISASSIDILQTSLLGIFQQNNLSLGSNISDCLDQMTASRTVEFITKSLLKGKTGSSSQLITLIDDLHDFYNSLPSDVVKCFNKNEQFLFLSYKYGIGYLPLAEDQYKNYTKANYLKAHMRFGQIYDKWTNLQYKQSGFQLSLYAHEIFPVVKKDIRGVWLTNVASSALDSYQNIEKAVDICSKAHINTIFVVVYNNARTIYPSQVMYSLIGVRQQQKFQGRDPLKELIIVAKKYQIQVHAWFQYGFSSSYSAGGGPIIAKRPTWKALDSSGKLVVKNGFDWLNAFDPQVQQFMIDLFKEVIRSYEVDGVQGDDRLPGLPSTAGYQNYTIQLYKKENGGKHPPMNYTEQSWVVWRVNKLNQFMRKLYFQVKELSPTIYLSMAPSPYPWSKYEYLQDWPTWAKYNWIDAVIPQCYRYNITAYVSVLEQQIGYLKNEKLAFAAGVLLNVGDYVANVSFLSQMMTANRNHSLNGESFFYYEGVSKQIQWFQSNYKMQNLLSQQLQETSSVLNYRPQINDQE